MRRLERAAMLVTALALTIAGAATLIVGPPSAGAEGLAPAPADFSVAPGARLHKEYTEAMVGSADVKPSPNDCRDNPAIGLTCTTHRIKLLERRSGYFLRITTSWLARDGLVLSVPDVDTYLYDNPDTSFDTDQVGGAGQAVPETIKLVNPATSEYDLMVFTYAGAITSYAVTVEFTNEPSMPTPGIPADFTVSARSAPVEKTFTAPLAVPTITGQAPDSCRNDPTQALVCHAYRLKLNRNLASEATNFVVITLEWDVTQTPDLRAGIVGLGGEQVPNLDMYVFDSPGHILEGVNANLFSLPERAAFVASQDEYDLVVQTKRGFARGFTLRAWLSDEIFDKPFELLDPITGEPISTPVPDGSGGLISPISGEVVVPPLALAPIDVDSDIAGIGHGATEQFDLDEALRQGRAALRNASTSSDPPSGLILLLTLVLLPAALFAGALTLMRRRHSDLF